MIDPSLLDRAPIFAATSPAARAALAAGAVERRYPAGTTLFTAGSEAHGLIVVLEGRVRVVRAVGPRQHVVHIEGAGGTLGEVPLYAGGGYPATAVTAAPTRCLVVSRRALEGAIAADPRLAWALLARLAARARDLVRRLDAFAGQKVLARLATVLLERSGGKVGAPFALGTTQTQLAEDVGTVREVLVRALRRLRAEGAIGAAGRGRLVVLDPAALRRIARSAK